MGPGGFRRVEGQDSHAYWPPYRVQYESYVVRSDAPRIPDPEFCAALLVPCLGIEKSSSYYEEFFLRDAGVS